MTIASRLKLNIVLSTAMVFMMMAAFGAVLIIENGIREQSLFTDQLMSGVFELSLLTDYYIRHPEARPKGQWRLKHAALLELLKDRRYEQDGKRRLEPINQSLNDLEVLFNELIGTYASGRPDETIVRQKREQLADLIIMRSRAIAETTARMAAESRAEMAAVTRQIGVVFPVLSLILLAMTVWSATRIRNRIAGPIGQLRQGAAIIGTGQLDYRIGLTSADEFGQLAGEFNRMAQRLNTITASRDELSQEVAERQRAEAALEKAAEQRRLAMEAAELGAWDYRFDTGAVIWDARCQTLWGISHSDRIDYAAAMSSIHPEDRAAIEEALKQALAGANRGKYHPEFRVVWPDGSVHWVVSYGRVYFAGEGDQRHPVRFIGVNRDITQEKRTAEMIRESQRQNEFLASVLERASQPFAVGYPDGRLGLANRAFEQLTGYHGDELRAINWVETLTPPPWHAFEQQQLEELHRSGQPVRYEKEYLRKDGTRVPIELLVHLATAADGRPEYYYSFLTDITERKRAEAALRLSEERLASTLNSLLDGVITVDEQQQITLFNPAAERLFGCRAADLLGQPLDRLIPERFRAAHTAHIRAFGHSNVTRRKMGELLAVSGLHTDGKEFPIEAAISQTEVAGQKLFTVILRDITERKRAEQLLQLKEAELSEAQRLAHIGSWHWDAKTDVTTGSDELLRIYGFDPATQAMPNFKEQRGRCYPVEDWERLNAAVQRTVETGIGYGLDVRAIRNDTMIWVTTRSEVVRDAEGRIVGLRGTVQDITERKRAEAALRESEQRLSRAQELAHLGSWELDLVNNVLTWSDEVYRVFGLRPQEFGATYEAFLERVHPDDRPAVDAAYTSSLRENRNTYEIEHRVVRQDTAEIRVVHEKCEHFRDATGRIIRSVGMIHDITERQQAEAALLKRTEELTRSNKDLEQFAYVASHDLQEPLRAVAGCVQLLQKRYQGQLDERADEFITHAVEGAKRMRHLIDDLLAFSRVGTRGRPLQPVDSGAALAAVLANLTAAIHDSGAVITHDPLPTVTVDPTQLTLLLQNLISNAIKFRREVSPRIHVGAQRQDHHWVLSVRDNGIGIEPQYFERIFGIFQRLHTRREYAGTGIGLAICKKIVERHGGRIWVESVPGAGCTFYCSLPDGQ